MAFEDIIIGTRLLWRLPSFLRHPITPDRAREIVRRRLEQREADFLALVRQVIYQYSESPYRQLLQLAGCEYGDLQRLVQQEGVEGALRTLLHQGVYLTVEEFKGRTPVRRGSTTLTVASDHLRNPYSAVHIQTRTSGSRGASTPVGIDLANIRDQAVDFGLFLDGRGGTGWDHAHWGVPGSYLRNMLRFSGCGALPKYWFSQVDAAAPGLHPRYRWSERLTRWGSLLVGAPLPRSQYVSLENPLPIARWMAAVLAGGTIPHLQTHASAAVRLCQAAAAAGIELRGAQFTLVAEPVTAARLAVIHRVSAAGVSRYATAECGCIAYGCLAPEAPDDMHVLHDLHALIQVGPAGNAVGLPSDALLLTSLRLTAPYLLLNVSLGDQATVRRRACRCPLESLGWTQHLHTLRSYEKLTAGGMTFLDADVIRILEVVLPSRFGGVPTDYQLVEEEGEDGRPRLCLLVHPVVGPLDTAAVAQAFLAAISPGSGVERVMGLAWRAGSLLQVERRPPEVTAAGKILHLHQSSTSDRGSG